MGQLYGCTGDGQTADSGGLVQLPSGVPAGEPVCQRSAVRAESTAQHSTREASRRRRYLRYWLARRSRQVISQSVSVVVHNRNEDKTENVYI